MDHSEKAAENFLLGYNCSQAVAVAFCEELGMDEKTAARLSSAFGGGMGRMRQVCGAFSGMMLVLGLRYGYDTPGDDESKRLLYTRVQALAEQFRQEAGSIVCREILGNPSTSPDPTPRTAEFYKTRPCARMTALAARLLDEFMAQNPLEP